MNGSIQTNKRFKEKVELFKKENTIKQENLNANCLRHWRWRDALHDESDDDEDFVMKELQRMMETNNKSLFQTQTMENTLWYTGIIHRHITGKKLRKYYKQAEKAELKYLQKKSGIDGEICWDWPTTEGIEIVDTAICF